LKDVERRLVSELLKNSQRSDRELAKALRVSQPTVSRLKKKLENQGVIREYTIIPDFHQLGYDIMAVIFLKLGQDGSSLSPQQLEEMFSKSRKLEKDNPRTFLLVKTGIGLNHDMIVISLFHDYSEYADYIRMIKTESTAELSPYFEGGSIEAFVINLEGKTHYQPLTLSRLAMNLQRNMEEERG
jgi:DNA-binding Lrp family transcriptional regulator